MKKFIYTIFITVAVFVNAKAQQFKGLPVSKNRLTLDITKPGGVQLIVGSASLQGLGAGGAGAQLVTYLKDAITLPVTLSKYDVKKNYDNVELSWVTVSERNFSHFEVLRSTDGKTFNNLSNVYPKSGSNNEAKSYSFTDFNPIAGVNYYKLKMIDLDGSVKESKILFVNYNLNSHNLVVYKENETLRVKYNSLIQESGEIEVFSIAGVKMYSQNKQFIAGDNSFIIPLSLSNSVLIVTVSSLTKKESVKIVY
ncbi:hypothetical protein Pedsa_0011 [Pseudopedobacter saltans DSM 12145]|uniref:Uncharacterized protein n=1 Tax=Pseudopedobacter saltans (strain ATCC 51119 / DSM 12145 / JCM 21818 / CCUG 39354 / LMG 10337 / NBRC 100064 / NCIMB 13643) TaxID=762903 RepID=F0SC15_PSESL|nr:hypothetical protein [Pseudopedobacter saltans]ADY50600.1 hypothetical protein Pedsa_0011 [Pseudopedobacter saltans DSM 12145]